MRVLYIETQLKQNQDFRLTENQVNQLPKEIFITYSVQYKDSAKRIKDQLASKIKIKGFQQVLGCSRIKTKFPILFIGTGSFHLNNLLLQSPEIFILSGEILKKVKAEDIEKLKIKRKTAYLKYLSAENLGILVTTKPGQENLKQALILKKKLKKQNPNKNYYIFLSNNINISQFENFKINSWINTACPGLASDNFSIINLNEITTSIK
jgi:diphthamide biosynthesis enzyme Dph1/Dph2-like protein